MLRKTENYYEIADTFRHHDLQIEIIFSCENLWRNLEFSAKIFQQLNITAERVRYTKDGSLNMCVLIDRHVDLGKLENAFRADNAPDIVRWTTIVGKMHAH